MTKLNKTQIAERDTVAAKVRESRELLQLAVEAFNGAQEAAWHVLDQARIDYNETIDDAWQTLVGAIDEYNSEALAAAADWRDGIVSEIEEYVSERSEKWEESDRGQAVAAWKDAFAELDLSQAELEGPEPIDMDEPEELTIDDLEDVADQLEQLPEEVEG